MADDAIVGGQAGMGADLHVTACNMLEHSLSQDRGILPMVINAEGHVYLPTMTQLLGTVSGV